MNTNRLALKNDLENFIEISMFFTLYVKEPIEKVIQFEQERIKLFSNRTIFIKKLLYEIHSKNVKKMYLEF